VNDILWGQYCLFLCIKIHDDLYDRHTNRPSLIYAGDEFLLKANRVFSLHFRASSSFWDFFYSSLRESLRAIVALNDLQLSGNARGAELLKYYTKEYSLCKIGSYAICLQGRRSADFSQVSAFSDEMAVIGQVVDDLQDIKEDIEDGRLNYAAGFLLRGEESRNLTSRQLLKRIARDLLLTDASTRLFRQLHRRLSRAEKLIRPLRLSNASEYLDFYRMSLDNMEDRLHRQRVELLFRSRTTHLV